MKVVNILIILIILTLKYKDDMLSKKMCDMLIFILYFNTDTTARTKKNHEKKIFSKKTREAGCNNTSLWG